MRSLVWSPYASASRLYILFEFGSVLSMSMSMSCTRTRSLRVLYDMLYPSPFAFLLLLLLLPSQGVARAEELSSVQSYCHMDTRTVCALQHGAARRLERRGGVSERLRCAPVATVFCPVRVFSSLLLCSALLSHVPRYTTRRSRLQLQLRVRCTNADCRTQCL